MALKSFRDRNRYVVGLVSLAVLGAVLAATFLVGTSGCSKAATTCPARSSTRAACAPATTSGSPGVRVGKVTEVRPDYGHGDVVVTWKVDDDVRLGRATRADITLSNLLGGRYVKLSGPVTAPISTSSPRAPGGSR